MGYTLGMCPQCNNVMSMPDDSAQVQCPTCQSVVFAAEAAALAGNSSGMQTAQPVTTQADTSTSDPWSKASEAAGTQYAPQTQGTVPPPPPYMGSQPLQPMQPAGPLPLGGRWQTNTVFTIIGIVAAMAINGFIGGFEEANTLIGIFSLIYVVFCIVYALKIYPSYFTDKPMIESCEAISALNGFVGGIIWGLLWNHNLTRGEKGISHIVYVALIAAVFLLAIVAAFAIVASY